MEANLRSDSLICRRVVRAFVDFLNSVQPAPDTDLEGLDVAKDCLEEAFKLNSFSSDDGIEPGMLIDLFSSFGSSERHKEKSDLVSSMRDNTSCVITHSQQVEDSNDFKTSNGKDQAGGPHVLGGYSRDELLGKFFAALDKINFFKISADEVEDPTQVAKATKYFDDALIDMETSEGQIINLNNLADMFKLQGNRSMQSKSYSEAVELYTCAIALCQRNAVYYCNRAAAFTQKHMYAEAIQDCLKSVEINPNYSKAYSRLGLAYYAQGNYEDALDKGFFKALQLDPNNDSVNENIRVTQQKLMEQYQQAEASQNIGSNHGQRSAWSAGHASFPIFSQPIAPTPPTSSEFANTFGAGTHAAGSTNSSAPFTPFPLNASTPTGFAEAIRSVASTAQAQQPDGRRPSGTSDEADGPEIRMDGNTSFRFGEAPEHVSNVLRSVIGMFSSQHGSQEGHRGSNGA